MDGCSVAADAERGVKRKQLQLARADDERWLFALAADVCVLAGFRRRSFAGLLLIIGGRMLTWWAESTAI